ncbi:hypothetical protein K501DRAFT_274935 [Backusella circina FSU 941]|nr:hypothetical protein K501DRAFT_274935 [Backusella circina FSU 941]
MKKLTVVAGIVPLARGENLKLFLLDAGLEFDYIRVPLDDTWKSRKAEIIKRGYYIGSLPYVEVDGKIFGRAVPILRYISTKLGKYLGSTPEENQYIDAMADISDDWFQDMKKAFFDKNKDALKSYHDVERPTWLSIYEKYYSDVKSGPYIGLSYA